MKKTATQLLKNTALVCMLVSFTPAISFAQKASNAKLIQGTWTDVRDSSSEIHISAKKWAFAKNDISAYYLFGENKDSIGVVLSEDTLIYHIESVDKWNLDLNYLGRIHQISGVTIISYRKAP